MAEVAYGNFQHPNYPSQNMGGLQHQYVQGIPGNGYVQAMNARFNPYQRPSPPMQQGRNGQSPPLMQYRPTQMVARHQQMYPWNPHMKQMGEDFNANPQPIHIPNANWQHGNWPTHNNRPMSAVSPPVIHQNFGPNTSPMLHGMPSLQEQVMRRRMSSSSQSSEYSATSGIQGQGNDNRWMVSPSSTANVPNGQFNQQQCGIYSAPQVSPNPVGVPNWNSAPSLPYSTPSPMSSISSENTSPPPVMPFVQHSFRPPSAIPQTVPTNTQPPQIPIVPSEIPPGTTTGTSGNDWEVNCLGAKVKLRNCDLWKNFENVVMEMVISKHGRRMFPVLEYDVKGLHPHKLYSVFVDFVLANKYVWKFSEQKWNPSGLAPEEDIYDQSHRVCLHPESPAPGEVWNKRGVSFSKMKLSNHLHTDSDKVRLLSLKSLHKYQPRLHVVEVDPRDPSVQTNLRTFIIPKTQFMTVTLYHNTDVAQLKINLNPFARCFRDKEISPSTKSIESTPSPAHKTEAEMSRVDDATSPWNQTNDVIGGGHSHDPQVIQRVPNPVPQSDLERAQEFMQQQLATMTKLVKAQDALSGNQQRATTTSVTTVTKLDDGKVAPVDFDRELEGLLSNITDGKDSNNSNNNKKTVHHYAPDSSANDVKPPIAKKPKTADRNPLDKYELLNVDRCFPPNAIAPLSSTLPFDPSKVKSEAASSGGTSARLPTFFRCSYYQEQAALAALNTSKQDVKPSLPVIYVPKAQSYSNKESPIVATTHTEQARPSSAQNVSQPSSQSGDDARNYADDFIRPQSDDVTTKQCDNTTNNVDGDQRLQVPGNDVIDLVDTSPAPSASSNESAPPFHAYSMPALSPKSLQQFLDPDINEMMSGNKRKCSFDDDIDDDVFAGTDEASLMNACGIFNPQNQPFLSNVT